MKSIASILLLLAMLLAGSLAGQIAPAPPNMPGGGGSPDGYEPVGEVGLEPGITDSGEDVDREEIEESGDPNQVDTPAPIDPDEAEEELDNEGNIRLPSVREDMEAQQADIDDVVGVLDEIAAEEAAALNNVYEEVSATETAGDGAFLGQRRLPAALMIFAPERLFKSLPGIANPVRELFILLSFPILIWAMATKMRKSANSDEYLRAVADTLIVTGLVLMVPWILGTLDKFSRYVSYEINERVNGVVTDDTVSRMYNLSVIFGNMDSTVLMNAYELSDGYDQARRQAALSDEEGTPGEVAARILRDGGGDNPGAWDRLGKFLGNMKDSFFSLPDPVHDIGQWLLRWWDHIMAFLKIMLISILGFVLQIVLTLCAYIILFMENLRMLMIYLSAVILPVFIAGTLLESFRTQSFNFIFGVIGIFAWPIGWALGNVGTTAILMAFAEYLSSISSFHMGGGVVQAAGLGADLIAAQDGESVLLQKMGGTLNGESPLAALHPTIIAEVIFMPLAYWGVFAGLVVLLFGWVITTTIAAPLLIQRVVATGSNFAQSLVAGTVQAGPSIVTAAATAATAGLAAAAAGGATQAATAGGQGPSSSGGSSGGTASGGVPSEAAPSGSGPSVSSSDGPDGGGSGRSPGAAGGSRMAQIANGLSAIGKVVQPAMAAMQGLGAFLDDAKPMAPTIRPMEYRGQQGQADMQTDWHNDSNQGKGR